MSEDAEARRDEGTRSAAPSEAARGAGPASGARVGESLALGFVIGALLLLLVVPVLTDRNTVALRETVESVAEPARDSVTAIQYELARAMSSLRGYLLTRDTSYLVRYQAVADRQTGTLAELSRLAAELGPEAAAATATLQERVRRWHERVAQGVSAGVDATTDAAVRTDQTLYEQALAASTAVDQLLGRTTRALREQIRRSESQARLLTLLLSVPALVAAGLLVWFGRRLRSYAAAADRQRREAEAALEATRQASAARDRLMRGVTHDVKNPLGAADGYGELLELGLKGPLSQAQAETVGSMRRSIRSALTIIDDLLELARAERSRLPLAPQEVELTRLVARVAELHRGAVEAAGQTLELALPNDPIPVRTDPRRVEQVLSNLLSNANKYGGRGARVGVTIGWHGGGAVAELDRVDVAVWDTGPGIPADQLDEIFTEFHRVHEGRGSGHGLGLTIARHVARQLGGDLVVDSAAGEGARFTLQLPVERTAAHVTTAGERKGQS